MLPRAGLLFNDLVLGQEYLIQLYAYTNYFILSSPGCNCRSTPGQIPAPDHKKKKKTYVPREILIGSCHIAVLGSETGQRK